MNTLADTPALAESLIRDYYCRRDYKKALDFYDKDQVSWIGMTEKAMALDFDTLTHFFAKGSEHDSTAAISDTDFRMVSSGEEFCVVIGTYRLHFFHNSTLYYECMQRVTFVFAVKDGALKIIHQHLSAPSMQIQKDHYYPQPDYLSSYEQLITRTRTDALTGASNREYLIDSIREYLKTKSDDVMYSCLLLDIDHFKLLNDTCGHLKGDEVLMGLVHQIKKQIRSTDLVARLGGDEFMIFMKDLYATDIILEKAQHLLECIRSYGEAAALPVPLTVSIGITFSRSPDCGFQELYRQADIALYNAKAMGRNCCCIYQKGLKYPGSIS